MAIPAIGFADAGNEHQVVLNASGVPIGIQNAQGEILFALLASDGSTVAPTLAITNASYVKTALPTATHAGQQIYVSNATGAHVTGSLCFWNGTSWIDVTTGIAVV
jgi:hypothetical protein